MKKCSECGIEKELSEFSIRQYAKKLNSICKICIKQQQKEYYEKNKEKLKKQALKRHRTEEGREKSRIAFHKRESMKKKAISTLTVEQWKKCKEYFNYSCAYCGIEGVKLTQDHFIPVSDGGEYARGNIIPSCGTCNSKKRAQSFFKWYPIQRFYDERRESKILNYLGYQDQKQQMSFF